MNSLSNLRRFWILSHQYLTVLCLTLHLVGRVSAQTINSTQTDQIINDAGSMGKADPGDRIRYTVTITESGNTTDATGVTLEVTPDMLTTFVPGSFRSSPLAITDNYTCTGNIGIQVPAGSGLLVNDFDDTPAGLMAANVTNAATAMGGQITIAADGSFIYLPPAGLTGTDSYTYTLIDGNPVGGPVPATDNGTVTFAVTNLIWFLDNTGGGTGGDGRLNSPYKTLTDFNTGSTAAGDIVYVKHTGTNYSGGILLANNERLFGEGHSGGVNLADVLNFTLAPNSLTLPDINGSRPIITNLSGNGVTLATSNVLRGIGLGNCSAFAIDDNGAVGSLSVSEVYITNATGGGIRSDNGGVLAIILDSLTAMGGLNGVNLSNCSGSFQVTGKTSVTNSSSTGVSIAGNSATVNFGVLNINNSTSNQTGLFTSGGLLSMASGVINTGSGKAIDIDNVGLDITLTSVSSNGGSTVGIDLNSTTGSFSVTGTATIDGSGGTIQNKTGNGVLFANASNISLKNMNLDNCASTNGPGPCGNSVTGNSGCNAAVYMSNVTNVILDNIRTQNGQYGINGINVTNFDLLNSFVDNHGDQVNEDGIRFVNLFGMANITGNTIEDSYHNNIFIFNDLATALTLNVGGVGVGQNMIRRAGKGVSNQGNDGILLEGINSANMTAFITNNIFNTSDGDHVQIAAGNNSVWNVTVNNNTMNTATTVLGGGITLSSYGNWNGQMNYAISGNELNDCQGAAINVNLGTTTLDAGTGTYTGSVNNNTISADGPGILLTANGGGTLNATLQGNNINRFDADYGIRVLSRDGSPTINTTLNLNNINANSTNDPFVGLLVQAGAATDDGGTICVKMTNNDLLGSGGNTGGSTTDFRLRQRFNTTINLPGYTGLNTSTADVVLFVQSQGNTGTGSATVDLNGFTGTGINCN